MRQVLLIVDVQTTFEPPDWLVKGIQALAEQMPSVVTIELHNEEQTPFQSQLSWCPNAGYSLFNAELRPTLITDLTVGSSLDRSGQLGISLWKHHFRQTTSSRELAMEFNVGQSS